jgi:hypothetical protein
LTPLARGQLIGLANGDRDQQPPEVIAIVKLRKSPLFSPATETGESAQGNIFLVGGAPGQSLQLLAGQTDQALKIPLPKVLRGGAIASLELRKPSAD